MPKSARLVGAVLLILAAGGAAFVVGRQLRDDSTGEAQQVSAPSVSPEEIRRVIDEEAAKPRFEGELLGLYIAPSSDRIPAEWRAERDELVAQGCKAVPIGAASELVIAREVVLPGKLELQGPPEAIACGSRVTGVNYEFAGPAANGLPATVLIARSIGTAWDISASVPRVATRDVEGRSAVLISPITKDGTAQMSNVLFPEPFGATAVYAFNLGEDELIAVAEAIAAATK